MDMSVRLSPDIYQTYTKPVNQYTKNFGLSFVGVTADFPLIYEISNSATAGNAVAYKATEFPLPIPDAFFMSGEYISIWFTATVEKDGESVEEPKMITIPIIKKPVPIAAALSYDEENENLIMNGEPNNQIVTPVGDEEEEEETEDEGSNENEEENE